MKKRGSSFNIKRSAKSGMILGRERFAKINAVEGIVLTPNAPTRPIRASRL